MNGSSLLLNASSSGDDTEDHEFDTQSQNAQSNRPSAESPSSLLPQSLAEHQAFGKSTRFERDRSRSDQSQRSSIAKEHYHRGYATYIVFMMTNLLKSIVICYAGLQEHKIVSTLLICFFMAVVIDVAHAICWRGIGDGNAVFVVPAIFFGIELSQSALFLGTEVTDYEFWGLLVVQKGYSVLRNSGATNWLKYKIMGHPTLIIQKRDLERRYLYAAADNFAEVLAPVVVLGTVLYEMVFRSTFGKGRAGVSSSVLYDLQDEVSFEYTTVALATLIVLRIGVIKLECMFGNWLEKNVSALVNACIYCPSSSRPFTVSCCFNFGWLSKTN